MKKWKPETPFLCWKKKRRFDPGSDRGPGTFCDNSATAREACRSRTNRGTAENSNTYWGEIRLGVLQHCLLPQFFVCLSERWVRQRQRSWPCRLALPSLARHGSWGD